jgi:hypothetical protein
MGSPTQATARVLAQRSSRRQFFKFMSAASVGTGLFLTRSGVSLGGITACTPCEVHPCNPCNSPQPPCATIGRPCIDPCFNGGCGQNCTTVGEWWCCVNGCKRRCAECSCDIGCCHCFQVTPLSCGAQFCPC